MSPAQKAIELILMRQLAEYLAMPILIADRDGNLLFFNQPAEAIYGRPFSEMGEMRTEEWVRTMLLFEEDGSPIPPERRPLLTALREHRPVHRRLRLQGLDGRSRLIESTAFPLEGQGGRQLGGVVIFWALETA